MNTNRNLVIGVIVVLILIILGTWWFSRGPEEDMEIPENGDDTAGMSDLVIEANHEFAGGIHTLEGQITLATPCHGLDVEAVGAGATAETVTIAFTVTEPAEGTVCTQVTSDKIFSVSFEAPEDVEIVATVNGEPVFLDLREDGSAIEKL